MAQFAWISLLTISLLLGLSFYISSQSKDVADFEEEIQSDGQKRKELFIAMEKSLEIAREPASIGPIMKFINPDDPIQVLIGNIVIARSREPRTHLNEEMKARLKENPAESFKSLKGLFDTLPYNEFPGHKAALITLAIEVNAGKPEDVQELALNHLLAEAPQDDVNLSNIAYEAYLINSNDGERAMSETFKILDRQTDSMVRENIIDNFNQKFPLQSKLLKKMITESKMNELSIEQSDDSVDEVAVDEEEKEGTDN